MIHVCMYVCMYVRMHMHNAMQVTSSVFALLSVKRSSASYTKVAKEEYGRHCEYEHKHLSMCAYVRVSVMSMIG